MKVENSKRTKTVDTKMDQIEDCFQRQLSVVDEGQIIDSDVNAFAKWCDRHILRNYHLKAPEHADAQTTDTFFAW